ncbi:MAG: ATP-binding protein, partial [Alphaproteobacteria bacterium]
NRIIQYSEDESKLLINYVIRTSIKPILFVEGISDVDILKTAYKKLYPDEDMPILVQDAFDRGFIKILMSRDELFVNYPDKWFFSLFDFDKAYEDWRDLGGNIEITDIEKGMCRKKDGKKAYAFMLPIPNNKLKKQVWNDDNPVEKIISNPHFTIEHIFWNKTSLASWFIKDEKSGFIRFKGDKHKVKFAKDIVPTLDESCFKPFRPMFEFIKKTIGN